jgi:WhiB family redox-sensing transcriptional regulator
MNSFVQYEIAPCALSTGAPRFLEKGEERVVAAQEQGLIWQERAACRGPLGAVFFPPVTSELKREKLARESRAKEICRSCSVMTDCRTYALEIREPHGVWGALSEADRKALL